MLFFLKLNNRNCGNMLTVASVQNCDDGKCDDNKGIKHRQMEGANPVK
jgi:hypothetical protein